MSSKWASAEGGLGGHGARARTGYRQHELFPDSSSSVTRLLPTPCSLYVTSGRSHSLFAFYKETDVERRSHCPRSRAHQEELGVEPRTQSCPLWLCLRLWAWFQALWPLSSPDHVVCQGIFT